MNVSRRHFFFGTLLAGAVPSGGFGSVPSLRAAGYKPFYEKLNIAAIGCGGQGGADLNDAARTENIVALCDVDDKRAAVNFQKFSKAPKYKDFRVMLDKHKDIDACTIGIPDFMHATVALACMQQGKHVYVEKPLTRTPWEARLLLNAAAKYKVATQMGNQGFSHECTRVAAEIVWSGDIGDVTEAHFSTSPGTHPTALQQLPPEDSVPAGLDWDLWLGGASMRPFSSYYIPYNWRGFYDFGTGQIGNWATHTAGPVQFALQLGAPTSVECVSQTGPSKITYPTRATIRLRLPGARRHAAGEGFLPRFDATRRSGRLPRARDGKRSHSPTGGQPGGQGTSHGACFARDDGRAGGSSGASPRGASCGPRRRAGASSGRGRSGRARFHQRPWRSGAEGRSFRKRRRLRR